MKFFKAKVFHLTSFWMSLCNVLKLLELYNACKVPNTLFDMFEVFHMSFHLYIHTGRYQNLPKHVFDIFEIPFYVFDIYETQKTFSTHIPPKNFGIKHFKCCLYFLMFLLSYLRVERYKCLMCVSDLWVFFYTFDIFPFFVRRFELKIGWDMIIFAELNFWLIIVHCWNAEKISSISYTNQLFFIKSE